MDWIIRLPPCGPLRYNAIYTVVNITIQAIRLPLCVLGLGQMSEEATAKLFFDGIVRQYGLPGKVLHDRNTRFTADFWTSLWKVLGSTAMFSSAYHPQTEGRTERMHCTIEYAICCLLFERNLSEDMWCELLGFIEFTINCAVAEGTGQVPAE